MGTDNRVREAIAHRYNRGGLPTSTSQILVTSGACAALTLLAFGLMHRGASTVVESPTYPGGLRILRSAGVRAHAWPILDGRDLDLFAEAVRDNRAHTAYLILDFHNPTGALADLRTREHLVASATKQDVTLIVRRDAS